MHDAGTWRAAQTEIPGVGRTELETAGELRTRLINMPLRLGPAALFAQRRRRPRQSSALARADASRVADVGRSADPVGQQAGFPSA